MRKRIVIIAGIFLVFVVTVLVIGSFLLKQSVTQAPKESKCITDADCLLFGESGDCNCGCYTEKSIPQDTGGECFCQAPTACVCLNGKCEGLFDEQSEISNFEDCVKGGNPVTESYPRQCRTQNGETFTEELDTICNSMSLTEAKEIARKGECGDQLKETYFCNEGTKTWWIDLDIEKEGCNPACVVNTETRQSEINWRCTGLIPE